MWGPYHVEPVDRVRVWGAETLHELRMLAVESDTGVRLVSGIEASRKAADAPAWATRLDDFRLCAPAELPAAFAVGWRFTAPIIDMPAYLAYLQRRLLAAGAHIELRRIGSLAEAAHVAQLVVNCAGIGARDLVPDPALFPIRGQLVVVENPGITEFFSEDTGSSPDLLHYAPHGDTMILGGTAEPNRWSREPDPAVAAAIIARCVTLEPLLRNAAVIGHRVGLRPSRPRIRVEADHIDGTTVIHNYGHGGAGVSLSWGCAKEAETLAPS
jgi:D-amino-acid oxidase